MIDIFVPVYNEAENIKNLFDSMEDKIHVGFEVMIVYDTEEDNTLPVINQIKENYKFKIRLVKNKYGVGAINAFRTGLESIKYEYLLITMADLSDSLETVDLMYEKMLSGYDIVGGSRYIKGGKKIGGPPLKKFFSWASGLSMHFLIGIPLHDMTNCFKMFRRSVIEDISLEISVGFEIGIELTLKAYIEGYKLTEVPTMWYDRTKGETNFPIWKWIPPYLPGIFMRLRRFVREVKNAKMHTRGI